MAKPAYNLDGTGGSCAFCGKPVNPSHNYCDWDCQVGHAKQLGGRVLAPNGLPIRCVTRDNVMLEHPHGDHPTYKWPVKVQYIGPVTADERSDAEHLYGLSASATDEEVRGAMGETHALVYYDEDVAVTLYDCSQAVWDVKTGELRTSSLWKHGHWKLVSIERPVTAPSQA
jgi:hypothetical protein